MKRLKSIYTVISIHLVGILLIMSCDTFIPDDIDALEDGLSFSTREFTPYMGRTTVYDNSLSATNKTSLPLSFKILDIKDVDGESVPNILDRKFPVSIWIDSYTGLEKSIEEIAKKRKTEYRPAIEIQEKSGNFIFWNTTSFLDLQTSPYDGYSMDISISNSGGSIIDRGIKLKPFKARPYEPSRYDQNTGLAAGTYVYPKSVYNIQGEKSGFIETDIRINFVKDYDNKTPGNTLTISAVDSLYRPIDIKKFNSTKWNSLVHGFNHRFVGPKVVYDVMFPMPLVPLKTPYTNSDGTLASITLSYNRLNSFGRQENAFLDFDFAIYEEGHWEIVFRFACESPKFDND